MSLPNPSMSFTPFDILTAEEQNNLVENIEYIGSIVDDITKPMMSVCPGSPTQFPTIINTWTKVALNNIRYDTGNCFDTINYRWVAPYNCIVHVSAGYGMTGSGLGANESFAGAIFKNGAAARYTGYRNGSGNAFLIPVVSLSFDMMLSAGDYLESYFLVSVLTRPLIGNNDSWLDVHIINRI